MQNSLTKRVITIGIIVLFFGLCITPLSGGIIEEIYNPLFEGNILYVGGSGEGNYTKIQDAINDSSNGDTIFVFSGTYFENVVVDKSIKLIGENKNTTIVIGKNINDTICLIADEILIEGFTLRHNEEIEMQVMNLLYINSNDNIISNNLFISKPFRRETSIKLENSFRNLISQNIIKNNYGSGIELRNSHFNEVSGNIIIGLIFRRGIGIDLVDSSNNLVTRNEFRKNSCCVSLLELSNLTTNNQIIENNFLMYYVRMSGVYFFYEYHRDKGDRGNIIDSNYWNRPRIFPKYILGWISLFWMSLKDYGYLVRIIIPRFDMHPAKEPYDINV
jgi:parallel beta-helix repeat protein